MYLRTENVCTGRISPPCGTARSDFLARATFAMKFGAPGSHGLCAPASGTLNLAGGSSRDRSNFAETLRLSLKVGFFRGGGFFGDLLTVGRASEAAVAVTAAVEAASAVVAVVLPFPQEIGRN